MSTLTAVRIDGPAENPGDEQWKDVPAQTLELAVAPLGSQTSRYIRTAWVSRPYGLVRSVNAQAAHDGESIFLRLRWQSPTKMPMTGEPLTGPTAGADAFPDSVALIFPEAGDPVVSTKGAPGSPVRIWRWADEIKGGVKGVVESLTAAGLGSLGKEEGSDVANGGGLRASAVVDGEAREVVFSRPLNPAAGDGPVFAADKPAKIGVAVWVGVNQERGGIKSASAQWSELQLAE